MSQHGRVIDLGAGDDPDPRATETVDLYCEADHQFDLDERWGIDSASVDGLVASHIVEHLDVQHFFAEAGRVLADDGWLEVTVPIGRDAIADPSHRTRWTYWTPRMYCREYRQSQGRPWDTETAFVLENRALSVWLFGPFAPLTRPFDALAQRFPHWGARRCGAGELVATYRRVDR